MKKLLYLLSFILIIFIVNGCSAPQYNLGKLNNNKTIKIKDKFLLNNLSNTNYNFLTNKNYTIVLLCPKEENKYAILIKKQKNEWSMTFPSRDNICKNPNLIKHYKGVYNFYNYPNNIFYLISLTNPYFLLKINKRKQIIKIFFIPTLKDFTCSAEDDRFFKEIINNEITKNVFWRFLDRNIKGEKDNKQIYLNKLAYKYKRVCNRILTPLSEIYKKTNLNKYKDFFPFECTSIDINGRRFHDITWSGKFNKMAEPVGKGCLKCTITAPLSFPRYYTICTTIKNGKIADNGILYAKIAGTKRSISYNKNTNIELSLFKLMENNVNESNKAWGGFKLFEPLKSKSSIRNNSNCQLLLDKCLNYCKSKSKKGFLFNDKESCRRNCYLGKDECKEGNKRDMKVYMCRGICKGVNESNGGFFSSSDYDKCVNNCINSGEF